MRTLGTAFYVDLFDHGRLSEIVIAIYRRPRLGITTMKKTLQLISFKE